MRPENGPEGRQRSFIEEARRRQIIASAVEVIADRGYAGATLARIAAHAGISKGVVSYHFDGKDDLMTQVVVQLYVSAGEYIGPLVEAADGPAARLRAYMTANLDYVDVNRRFIAAMTDVVLGLREPDGRLRFVSADEDTGPLAPLVSILRDGQKSGDFGDFDATTMGRLIRDSIDAAAGRAARDPGFDLEHHGRLMISVYQQAVTVLPEEPA
ncbi:TetR family transcriptional regulator [Tsukamurella sp. 8F]|uniref:TetR/AcrR family transcriptional regulator n=1 Tax=unclassified Tsukamurella TaxID=2633480 RepID=UPI0023B8CFF5|nr:MULTISPECIES: TetR family transcriptional regulator [unclassified Tsukamurella]MDF0532089.1 TetR family transcriptional regulator [Tsukamurella sp. 8J]MDF0589201.1 TetR family transcriptional regulator [Tsukamurella sp. 8F]